jgi:hypothetical protein
LLNTKNDKKKTHKTANPLFDVSLGTSTFLVKLWRVASKERFHAIKHKKH